MAFFRSILLSALLFSVPAPSLAGAGESSDGSRPEWAEDGRNELAVFAGFTRSDADDGPSLGLDYEHRLTRLFGIGGTLEWTGADMREGVIAVAFDFHVWKELKLFVATGAEIETEDETDEFLVRLGIEYGFDIGKKWEIAPSLNFDVTSDENAIVLGAAFARSF